MEKVSLEQLSDGFQSVETRALSQLCSLLLEICRVYFYYILGTIFTLHSSTGLAKEFVRVIL